MALSERERQMLEEMEEAIRAEDPRFASQMNGARSGRAHRRRLIIGVIGAIGGLGLVLLGINTNLWIGVAGFALIVASVAVAVTPGGSSETPSGLGLVGDDGSVRQHQTAPKGLKQRRLKKGGSAAAKKGTFMQRMEQRWEERRQNGQGW